MYIISFAITFGNISQFWSWRQQHVWNPDCYWCLCYACCITTIAIQVTFQSDKKNSILKSISSMQSKQTHTLTFFFWTGTGSLPLWLWESQTHPPSAPPWRTAQWWVKWREQGKNSASLHGHSLTMSSRSPLPSAWLSLALHPLCLAAGGQPNSLGNSSLTSIHTLTMEPLYISYYTHYAK